MKHGKLRIAWSVVWGTATVLLCVLWMRSYSWWDGIVFKHNSTARTAFSVIGGINFYTSSANAYPDGLSYQRGKADTVPSIVGAQYSWLGFKYDPAKFGMAASYFIPSWFSITLCMIAGITPWFPFKRFSLRTLLIATTLVAVGLGLFVWAIR